MRFHPFIRWNFGKTESFRPKKTSWTFVKFCKIVIPTFVYFHKSCRHSAIIRQHLTVFPSYFNNIFLKYFRILQNLMRNYEILRKLMKAMIFHDIFLVKSRTFIPFHPIAMYYWHFIILYCDEWNFSVCYCTVLPLGNIGKYFAIIKQKVIFPILQIFIYKRYCVCSILQMKLN